MSVITSTCSEAANPARQLSAARLRRLLGRRKGQCTWCGRAVPRGRRTWCGPACVEAFRLRYDPGYCRRAVERRDRGICSSCGRDTRQIAAALAAMERDLRMPGLRSWQSVPWRSLVEVLRDYAAWEADRIVPVVAGGAALGLGNLRTLCRACHKRETAALAGQRARWRRCARRILGRIATN